MADYDESGEEVPGEVKKPGKRDDEAICKEARERYQQSEDVDCDNRANAREDTRFVWVKGAQWDEQTQNERKADRRPWLEINQLPQFLNQVINDARQQHLGVRVHPASGDASKEVAEILQGLIRNIEYESNAEACYDGGIQHAATGGRGYWRVLSKYEYDYSFDQCLYLQRIPDPDSVRMDPDYQDADGCDAKWCFVSESMNRSDFEKNWPDAEALSWGDTGELGLWYQGKDKVVIADYYRKVIRKRTLIQVQDGTIGWKDELAKELGGKIPEGLILRERQAEECRVEWHKLAGGEQVLEQIKWPGHYIPVVMCVGDEIMVEGRRLFQGLIRRARDPQQMYNYWQTCATELIALAPKAPWVAAAGQIEGFEGDWRESNTRNIPVLEYNAEVITTSGAKVPLPPPQRTQFAGVPVGIVEQANVCKADLRATIGIYDPSLGQRSNETSGRAIIARERQGDTATFQYPDNLSRAIALTGRILVDLIPHYYDTDRMVSVIDIEGNRKQEHINQQTFNEALQAITKNNLKQGRYAVTVEAGPTYQTRKLEAADSMMQFVQAYPPAGAVAGDLIAKSMDWPGAEQIAKRLKAILPPPVAAIANEGEGGAQGGPPNPMQDPQVQQVLGQMEQAGKALQAENQQLKAGVAEKMQAAQLQAQADKEAAMIKAASDREVAEINARTKVEIALIEARVDVEIEAMKPAPVPAGANGGGEPPPVQ